MINHWWVTRPKRRLDTIPEILVMLADSIIGEKWDGERANHLSVEEALEKQGLKRTGNRRDQGGSGARTYIAWLKSYGLVFEYNGRLEFTCAGEAIIEGKPPVAVLKEQILKFQYPSPFSISKTISSRVTERFKIRPFRFLLKLMMDPRLDYYITEDEVGFIVIEEAENESKPCYEKVVNHIIAFREKGKASIPLLDDFNRMYSESRPHEWSYYTDIANTIFNVLDYTQLIVRGKVDGNPSMHIGNDAKNEVVRILSKDLPFIKNPENEELFQRRYGIGPYRQKDTRNLDRTQTITKTIVMESKIKSAFITRSLYEPIYNITTDLIDNLVSDIGRVYLHNEVEDVVRKFFPKGAISGFYSNYHKMAFSGSDHATDFEKVTANIFHEIFGFDSKQIGQHGRVPDVVISSDEEHSQLIIDNKAYSDYTVNHDHFNRMVYTYIPGINRYGISPYPLKAFCYIAGGFGKNIESNLNDIYKASGIPGSALTVQTVIKMIEINLVQELTHRDIIQLMSSNKLVLPDAVESLTCCNT